MSYPLLKSLHLIFVVSWFAGLFYIFRLFVYHVQNWEMAQTRQVLGTMEHRLLKFIMLPAAAGSVFFGALLLLANPGLLNEEWLWLKLVFVAVLLAYRSYGAKACRKFSN